MVIPSYIRNSLLIVCGVLAVALAVYQVSFGITQLLSTQALFDFSIYQSAAEEYLNGNSGYAALPNHNGLTFLYPPFSLLLISVFSFFSNSTAAYVFSLLSGIAGVLALWRTRLLFPNASKPRVGWWLFICAAGIQTFPFKFTLALGQINLIVLFLCVESLLLLKSNNRVLFAFFASVIMHLKLLSLGWLPALLLRKAWGIAALFVIFSGLLAALTPSHFETYVSSVLPTIAKTTSNNPSAYDQSVSALLFRSQIEGTTAQIVKLFFFVGLYLYAFIKTKPLPLYLQLLYFLPLITFAPHTTWQHHLVLLYPWLLFHYRKWYILVPLWIVLILHPSHAHPVFLEYPVLVSYQTIVFMAAYLYSLKKVRFSTES